MDQHYHNATLVAVYDAINASRDDFDFYLRQFPKPPCRILDIGCGTGTFAIALAQLGYTVTGVDPASAMIAAAGAKSGADAVTWVTGYADDVPKAPQFDIAVMTGHAFQCILQDDDIKAFLGSIAARLFRGGSFWCETRNPRTEPWRKWTPAHAGPPIALADGRSLQVVHRVLAVLDEHVSFEETYHINDHQTPLLSQSTLRFMSLEKIESLARDAGLTIGAIFGDWSGAPFCDDSPEIILRLDKAY